MSNKSISSTFEELLRQTADFHKHLCPRQVVGVRMGMAAGRWLDLDLPQTNKRLLTIVETDGCGADGISTATGCWVGRRTLRVMDFGKMAATFIDTYQSKKSSVGQVCGLTALIAAKKSLTSGKC